LRKEHKKTLSASELKAAGLTPGLVVRRVPCSEGADNTSRNLTPKGGVTYATGAEPASMVHRRSSC
jgi:hypothetical protein